MQLLRTTFFNISRYFSQTKLLPRIFHPPRKIDKKGKRKRERRALVKEDFVSHLRFDYTFIDTPEYSTAVYRPFGYRVLPPTASPDLFIRYKTRQESSNPYTAKITGNWGSYLRNAWRANLNIRPYISLLFNKVPNQSANIFILLKRYCYPFRVANCSFTGFMRHSWRGNSWHMFETFTEILSIERPKHLEKGIYVKPPFAQSWLIYTLCTNPYVFLPYIHMCIYDTDSDTRHKLELV